MSDLKTCPYFPNHKVLPEKWVKHLNKCHKFATSQKDAAYYDRARNMRVCQHDEGHHIPSQELANHEASCPSKLSSNPGYIPGLVTASNKEKEVSQRRVSPDAERSYSQQSQIIEMYDEETGDTMLQCPYVPSHQIRAGTRWQRHLKKCRMDCLAKPESPFYEVALNIVVCRYNSTHHVHKKYLSHHEAACQSKKVVHDEVEEVIGEVSSTDVNNNGWTDSTVTKVNVQKAPPAWTHLVPKMNEEDFHEGFLRIKMNARKNTPAPPPKQNAWGVKSNDEENDDVRLAAQNVQTSQELSQSMGQMSIGSKNSGSVLVLQDDDDWEADGQEVEKYDPKLKVGQGDKFVHMPTGMAPMQKREYRKNARILSNSNKFGGDDVGELVGGRGHDLFPTNKSEETLLTCPYDFNHLIRPGMYWIRHLKKCRAACLKVKESPFHQVALQTGICRYSESHHIKYKDMMGHEATCTAKPVETFED